MTVTVSEDAVRRDLIREDSVKIQAIMQFLHSRGLAKSLAQLELETEISFFPGILSEGNLIDHALDTYVTSQAPKLGSKERSETQFPRPGTCVTSVAQVFEEIHGSANPTTVCWHPSISNVVATGAADRSVIIREIDTNRVFAEVKLQSPILSTEWTPGGLFVGCMGGELFRLTFDSDLNLLESILVGRPHGSKRITDLHASTNGSIIASVAKDSRVFLFNHENGAHILPPLNFQKEISAVCWIGEDMLVVAESENPLLTVVSLKNDKSDICGQICMNMSTKDPITSYTTLALAWDPRYRLLVACTSRNSVLVFSLPLELSANTPVCPVKTLYGMSIGVYDNPCVDFSVDGSFVYVTSDKRLLVFELWSSHCVFDVQISESKAVRWMRRNPLSDNVACVSFDHRLSILT
jgi:WD40 repeat protein